MPFWNGPAIPRMPSPYRYGGPYRYGPVNSGAARAIPVWPEFRNGPEHIYSRYNSCSFRCSLHFTSPQYSSIFSSHSSSLAYDPPLHPLEQQGKSQSFVEFSGTSVQPFPLQAYIHYTHTGGPPPIQNTKIISILGFRRGLGH